MGDYKIKMGIEPSDEYKKAKQDIIQALISVQKLSPQQQKDLITELFGAAKVSFAMQIFNQYFAGGEK